MLQNVQCTSTLDLSFYDNSLMTSHAARETGAQSTFSFTTHYNPKVLGT